MHANVARMKEILVIWLSSVEVGPKAVLFDELIGRIED